MKSDGRCEFAVAAMPRAKWDGNRLFGSSAIYCLLHWRDSCSNTMNEKGCAAFVLDIFNIKTTPFYFKLHRYPHMIEGKGCNESTFNKLLKIEINPFREFTVSQAFAFVEPAVPTMEQYLELTPGFSRKQHELFS